MAKDSKLKIYFSAYNYATFEYAAYLVNTNQQSNSGSYQDLKIRGAFTNDVQGQFIGIDLSNPKFVKGDMLIFKFRAVSSSGVVTEKDVRVLIGDLTHTMQSLDDAKVPTKLLIK